MEYLEVRVSFALPDVLPGRGDSAPKLLLVCEQQRGADEGRDTKHGALLAASQRASPINRCVHGRCAAGSSF